MIVWSKNEKCRVGFDFSRKRNRSLTDHTYLPSASNPKKSLTNHHCPHCPHCPHNRIRNEHYHPTTPEYHRNPPSTGDFNVWNTRGHSKVSSSGHIDNQNPSKRAVLATRFHNLFRTRNKTPFDMSNQRFPEGDAVLRPAGLPYYNDSAIYQSNDQSFSPFGYAKPSELGDLDCEVYEMSAACVYPELPGYTPPDVQELPTNSYPYLTGMDPSASSNVTNNFDTLDFTSTTWACKMPSEPDWLPGLPVPERNMSQGFNSRSPTNPDATSMPPPLSLRPTSMFVHSDTTCKDADTASDAAGKRGFPLRLQTEYGMPLRRYIPEQIHNTKQQSPMSSTSTFYSTGRGSSALEQFLPGPFPVHPSHSCLLFQWRLWLPQCSFAVQSSKQLSTCRQPSHADLI